MKLKEEVHLALLRELYTQMSTLLRILPFPQKIHKAVAYIAEPFLTLKYQYNIYFGTLHIFLS